ncbi:MAG: PAS domain-containing protein [Rhizobiales bacterium]|nr:PAS domain-containing protein [Hyphomicrobiales bacterium]
MNSTDLQLQAGTDPRLAVHETSTQPAWLWSLDGARILWANPVGAGVFGAANASALASRQFSPADPHRRQVAQLAGRLSTTGAVRLERLRGFGAALGGLVTCGCTRLDFADGGSGILVAAMELAGRVIHHAHAPHIPQPDAVGSTGHPVVEALPEPSQPTATHDTAMHGRDRHHGDPGAHAPAPTEAPPAYEQPTTITEAPAEFALFDAFDEPSAETARSHDEVAGETFATPASETIAVNIEPPPPAEPVPDIAPPREPSPYVEAVADEPIAPQADESRPVPEAAPAPPQTVATPSATGDAAHMLSSIDESVPQGRRHPLRFVWQMDADGRFSLGSDEFTRLIGTRTAAGFGRLWSEIADVFGLDPDGRVAKAVASRDTWSGIVLLWPVDGPDARLPVELSGLPIYDRNREFTGYRGFGVCRDLEGLARVAARRRHEFLFSESPHPLSADASGSPESAAQNSSQPPAPEAPVETTQATPKNVLPFRPANDMKSPSLTPVENNAFNELARQLSARLENETVPVAPEAVAEEPPAMETSEATTAQPDWLTEPAPPPQGTSARDRQVFDLLPSGVMIYRLDRLLYANRAFLEQVGHDSLHALEDAGGLDALMVDSGVSAASSTSATGTPVTISATRPANERQQAPVAAHLFSIQWDGEPAHALICAGTAANAEPVPAATGAEPAPVMPPAPSPVGHATAEELGAILDTAAEGVVMFDENGRITACNRSAEALFGHSGDDLTALNLADLFAPESQAAMHDYLAAVRSAGVASLLDHGCEVLGRVRAEGLIPLSVTMGRTQADGPNFFAVFRDLSQARKIETELLQARRQADRAANAKADVLARISHEVRTPLNAIIGFADVMIGEKFGALGNERYIDYMKDIRASGERVIAFIDDLLDLSRIETGKLDLAFVDQNLNELVEQCVAVMQPQANRERIIIRTSLAHTLPPVVADARALRQITLNLIGNSIHLANAGGQVIVSTALSDFGDVVLRVRDTGHGLNDNEVAAAMEPFRTHPPSDRASDGAGVSLSLTKALVEANRAQFQIKTSPPSGTLIEVIFARAKALTSS